MIEPGNQDTFSDIIRTATECLNYGMIFVGEDGEIRDFSPMAMDMLGLRLPEGDSHPEGKLKSGVLFIFLVKTVLNFTPDNFGTVFA